MRGDMKHVNGFGEIVVLDVMVMHLNIYYFLCRRYDLCKQDC